MASRDELQRAHERAVGDAFVAWLNANEGRDYRFARQQENPDLVYKESGSALGVEICDAYYGDEVAKSTWAIAEGKLSASRTEIREPDASLIQEINTRLQKKALKRYGPNTVLVLHVDPAITTARDMESLVSLVEVPESHGFAAIYLTGDFPAALPGIRTIQEMRDHALANPNRFRCWRLDRTG